VGARKFGRVEKQKTLSKTLCRLIGTSATFRSDERDCLNRYKMAGTQPADRAKPIDTER